MVIGTALGWSEWETVALAVGLAFLFGYTLTSLPLLRGGLALSAVIPIALASDTLSIAVMEVVDNAIMLAIPGAMDAGLRNELFWGIALRGARDSRLRSVSGQPLAASARQGARRSACDGHPRRPLAACGWRDRGGCRDLRDRCADARRPSG